MLKSHGSFVVLNGTRSYLRFIHIYNINALHSRGPARESARYARHREREACRRAREEVKEEVERAGLEAGRAKVVKAGAQAE